MRDRLEELRREDRYRAKLMLAYRDFIHEFGATHTVTFNFGPWVSLNEAFYRMKGYGGRIERIALGRVYYKRDEPRLAIMGFPEHLEKNPHWHCVVRAPKGRLYDVVEVCSTGIWSDLVPAGQLDMAHPRTLEKIEIYFTKELLIPGRLDNVFVYAPDWNTKTPVVK